MLLQWCYSPGCRVAKKYQIISSLPKRDELNNYPTMDFLGVPSNISISGIRVPLTKSAKALPFIVPYINLTPISPSVDIAAMADILIPLETNL